MMEEYFLHLKGHHLEIGAANRLKFILKGFFYYKSCFFFLFETNPEILCSFFLKICFVKVYT